MKRFLIVNQACYRFITEIADFRPDVQITELYVLTGRHYKYIHEPLGLTVVDRW